jgi:hypothetical protein
MEQGKPLSASEPLVDYDAVCQSVRAALEPARTHAISLHDCQGNVLWLSEGSLGPDEHDAVHQAMDAFADPHAAPVLGFDLGDSRSAVLARALDLRRCMVGAVMIVMDTRSIARGPTKLMTPKLQRALLEFAATQPTRKPTVPAPPPPNPVPARFAQEAAALPARSDASPPATQSPEPPTLQPLTPSAGLQRLKTAVPPELERLHAALRRTPISLQAQRLVPLS